MAEVRTHVRSLRIRQLVALVPILAVVACSGSDTANGPHRNPVNDAGTDVALTDAGSDALETDAGTDAKTGDHLAEQVVGAAGGTVSAPSGVSVEIPAGALTSNVTITIDEVRDAPTPSGTMSLGKPIQFGPEGQTFASPVKVKLPWSGPNDVPVEIAHAPRGGSSWSKLTDYSDFDATHVWAETSSFSWFQPVLYQGAPDTPIVLDSDEPTGWIKLIAVGETETLILRGTGFRPDTVVKLFKDGVTTATVTPVKLTKWGLEFTVPAAFTATLGLITIEAKNPQATVGDAAAVHVVKTPVVTSLSPSSVDIPKRTDGNYQSVSFSVDVTASDLPDDLSLCWVTITQIAGPTAAVLVAETSAPSKTDQGFAFTVTRWSVVTGTSDLTLHCSGVNSNRRSITFNLIES